MRLYKLPDRSFSIQGNAATFLNGISSNTLEAPLNAFLNQHGRIIATFRQKQISGTEFLISVPAIAVDTLFQHLERYIKLSLITVMPATKVAAFMDMDGGQTAWLAEDHPNSITNQEFTLFRLDHHIPLMGVDYQAGEFILNVDEYAYVSYTKGCFLGQEPVAKVHNRSRPTRKLAVRYQDECPPEEAARMTSPVRRPQDGRIRGFVFVVNSAK